MDKISMQTQPITQKDINLLKGLGYQYTEHGAILDKEGKYLDSIVHKGKVIKSFQTRAEFEEMNATDYYSDLNRTQQSNDLKAKEHNLYIDELRKEIDSSLTATNSEITLQKSSNKNYVMPISLTLLAGLAIFIFFKYFRKRKSFKYYFITSFASLVISTYLGFKNKLLTQQYYLQKASIKKSEWQKDAYLDYVKSQDSFFELNGYSFNWEWFLFTFLGLLLIAIIIRNTIFYDRIKSFINSIRR